VADSFGQEIEFAAVEQNVGAVVVVGGGAQYCKFDAVLRELSSIHD
jgi:hypothetical protein